VATGHEGVRTGEGENQLQRRYTAGNRLVCSQHSQARAEAGTRREPVGRKETYGSGIQKSDRKKQGS